MRKPIAQKAAVTFRRDACSYRQDLPLAQLLAEADDGLYRARVNGHTRTEWAKAVPLR